MGDISEMRGLIVAIGFMATFVALFSMIPSQFSAPVTALTNATYPASTVYGTDFGVGNYNETWYRYTAPMNETGGYSEFGTGIYKILDVGTGDPVKFGGHDIDLWYLPANYTFGSQYIVWRHNAAGGPIGIYSGHFMRWLTKSGLSREIDLYLTDLTTDYANGDLPYKVYCDHFYMHCDFWYNSTTYSTLIDAFNHHELYMQIGINFDQMGASFDAWSLIAQIITFQPLTNQVLPYPLGMILSAGLWACIGYLLFIFTLRVVGAVFGGGGA